MSGRFLWQIEWRALVALVICAISVGAIALVDAAVSVYSAIHPLGAAFLGATYCFFIGLLPVVAYGAPIYAALAWRQRASAMTAALIGVIPGLLLFLYLRT